MMIVDVGKQSRKYVKMVRINFNLHLMFVVIFIYFYMMLLLFYSNTIYHQYVIDGELSLSYDVT
jgi:hypothetical protein